MREKTRLSKLGNLLRKEFARKKKKDVTYSLRVMAQTLGISKSMLSLILNGREPGLRVAKMIEASLWKLLDKPKDPADNPPLLPSEGVTLTASLSTQELNDGSYKARFLLLVEEALEVLRASLSEEHMLMVSLELRME